MAVGGMAPLLAIGIPGIGFIVPHGSLAVAPHLGEGRTQSTSLSSDVAKRRGSGGLREFGNLSVLSSQSAPQLACFASSDDDTICELGCGASQVRKSVLELPGKAHRIVMGRG
jgi:hypothetical protein